jgi:hypothetical protein
MKCDVEVDSGVKKYIPSFLKIGSGIRNLIEVIHRQRPIYLRHGPRRKHILRDVTQQQQ